VLPPEASRVPRLPWKIKEFRSCFVDLAKLWASASTTKPRFAMSPNGVHDREARIFRRAPEQVVPPRTIRRSQGASPPCTPAVASPEARLPAGHLRPRRRHRVRRGRRCVQPAPVHRARRQADRREGDLRRRRHDRRVARQPGVDVPDRAPPRGVEGGGVVRPHERPRPRDRRGMPVRLALHPRLHHRPRRQHRRERRRARPRDGVPVPRLPVRRLPARPVGEQPQAPRRDPDDAPAVRATTTRRSAPTHALPTSGGLS
jgi:hypothetical protein